MIKLVPKNVKDILNKLYLKHNNGYYEAYVVGGAVRDFLLGRDSSDFDIATSATPEQIKEIFPKATTGGNAFLVSFVEGVEVATFRKDRSDCAEVAKNLKEDVLRRDFTINALAWFPTELGDGIIDYVGGKKDLQDRILRFVGDPEKRISEDPVRILRGVRFASLYNLSIERETYFEMYRLRFLLKEVPRERIQLEIIKAFKSNNTHRFLTMLEEMEMLEYIFPSAYSLKNIDGGDYHRETVLHHCLNAVKAIEDKDWKLKLAAFMHDYGKRNPIKNDKGFNTFKDHDIKGRIVITSDLKRLKFSNDIIDYVKNLCTMHMLHIDLSSERAIKKAVTKLYENNVAIKDFIYIRYADSKANSKRKSTFFSKWRIYRRLMEVINKKPPFSIKDLDIDGIEVMSILSIKPCRLVGDILRDVFEKVQEDLISNEKDAIIKYIKSNNYIMPIIRDCKDDKTGK